MLGNVKIFLAGVAAQVLALTQHFISGNGQNAEEKVRGES